MKTTTMKTTTNLLLIATLALAMACGDDEPGSAENNAAENNSAQNQNNGSSNADANAQSNASSPASCAQACEVLEDCPPPQLPPELEGIPVLGGEDCQAECEMFSTQSERNCIASKNSCEEATACLLGEEPNNMSNNNPMPNNNTNNTTNNEQSFDITWAGGWFIEADYEVSCKSAFRDPETKSLSGSWTFTIEGDNDSLTGKTNGRHQMTGSGNDMRLTLNGAFPLLGSPEDGEASWLDADSNITLLLDDLRSADEAHGSFSGEYETDDFALNDCKILSSSVKMTR